MPDSNQIINDYSMYLRCDPPSHLRFGQWFLSRYFPDVADPDLFFETNPGKAVAMILSSQDYNEDMK